MEQNVSEQKTGIVKRIASIDRFRGICIIAVFFQFILGALGDAFSKLSPILEHGEDGFQILSGVSLADLFAPMFIFIIGITFKLTFESRERKMGTGKAYYDMALRFLSLMGFGAFLGMIEDNVFEMIGGTPFSELAINAKILTVCSFVLAFLLVLRLISLLIKNKTFSKIISTALRYLLSAMGIAVIFFIWVSAADRIIPMFNNKVVSKRFGGYIWDTLENIGYAGLIALPFVKANKWGKLTCVLSVFFIYTVYIQAGGIYLVKNMVEGAPFSGVCWAGILLLGSFFMDLKNEPKKYWAFAIGMIAFAVILNKCFGLITVKRGCTPVYALLCSGIGAVIFGLLGKLDNWKPKFRLFTWWGGSCILTYALTLMLSFVISFILDSLEVNVNTGIGTLVFIILFGLFTLVNYLLSRKEKHVKL